MRVAAVNVSSRQQQKQQQRMNMAVFSVAKREKATTASKQNNRKNLSSHLRVTVSVPNNVN